MFTNRPAASISTIISSLNCRSIFPVSSPTKNSTSYFVTYTSKSRSAGVAVFTRDTLFFKGTVAEVHAAFQGHSALPVTTVTYYVVHDYTAGNLRFAPSFDPVNPGLARPGELVATLLAEKEWDVFCRLTSELVR